MIIQKGNYGLAKKELENDKNNAVIFINQNPNKNKGTLEGAVFSLKSNFAIKNHPVGASSNILENFRPSYDSYVFEALIKAGAQFVAQVNCDELALGGTGTYSNKGIIRHPFDNSRIIGGSSSGSAATFTENICFAIGSDTGDSVRLPSSYIGKVGFKPSYGAVSRWGLFQYASSLDTVAWFSHNVNDSYEIAKVLYSNDKRDMTNNKVEILGAKEEKPKKVAYFDCFDYLDPLVAKEYKNFIQSIKKSNIECIKIELDLDLLNSVKTVYDIISFSEASSNLSNLNGIAFGQRVEGKNWEDTFIKTRTKGFGRMVQRRLTLGSFFLEEKNQKDLFLRAQKIRRLIYNWMNSIYDKYDILLYPSADDVAPKLSSLNDLENKFMKSILTVANLVGNPSININLGYKESLAFNINIDAGFQKDKQLFSYALFLEKMWKEKNDR